MAKELTKKEVEHVAGLAKISLSDKEVEKFRGQLEEILGLVSRLQEVETKNVKPLSQTTGLKNVWREDKIEPSLSQTEALSNAPNQKKGYFKVKPIL